MATIRRPRLLMRTGRVRDGMVATGWALGPAPGGEDLDDLLWPERAMDCNVACSLIGALDVILQLRNPLPHICTRQCAQRLAVYRERMRRCGRRASKQDSYTSPS
jgi:hypothetical protein